MAVLSASIWVLSASQELFSAIKLSFSSCKAASLDSSFSWSSLPSPFLCLSSPELLLELLLLDEEDLRLGLWFLSSSTRASKSAMRLACSREALSLVGLLSSLRSSLEIRAWLVSTWFLYESMTPSCSRTLALVSSSSCKCCFFSSSIFLFSSSTFPATAAFPASTASEATGNLLVGVKGVLGVFGVLASSTPLAVPRIDSSTTVSSISLTAADIVFTRLDITTSPASSASPK
mmetsp:Transcript_4989/g.9392  ORF Transcript_4989/g.9392 Transcript_4989/m.9392 type:complete len:233 (+) Transcript_4989:3223-3921(+)